MSLLTIGCSGRRFASPLDRIGVAAQEIGSGVSVTVNGDEAFAMASTYKVAIATTLLDRDFKQVWK